MKKSLLFVLGLLLSLSYTVNAQYSGTGTFGKITSLDDFAADTYYVLYGVNGDYEAAMSNAISGGRLTGESISFADYNIVDPSGAIVWKVEGDETNGYTLFNEAASVYCEVTTSSTSGFTLEATALEGFGLIYDETDGFVFRTKNTEGGSRSIALYQTDFRPYSNPNTLYLYKLGHTTEPPTGSLELTTPNGGETYSAGETVQLAWNSTDVSNVYFEVLGEDGTWEQISDEIASVDGTNTYDFTIPANAWSWDGYKLKVVDASASSINDESDATFTIDGHDTELLWEDFGSGTFNNFAVGSSGTVAWEIDNYGDDYYAKASGYNEGANETWLISPSIDLDNTTNEILEFITASNYSGPDMVVKYSTDYDGLGDPSTATWTEFSSYVLSAGNWEWISSGYIDMSFITGTVNIAFIYTSTETEAKTWEVTDIELTGVGSSTSVNKTKESAVKIIPNPFTTEFRIDGDAVSVTLYNAAGQLVKNVPAVAGVVSTSDLSKGMYILQVKLVDGTVSTQKVIKK